ncbi:IBR domain-containing protein [Botrytis cinerea]
MFINKVRRRPKFRDGELEDGKGQKARSGRNEGESGVTSVEPDVSEVRRIRLERLEGNSTNRSTRNSAAATEKMPADSSVTVDATKSSSHRRRRRHHTSEDGAGHHSRSEATGREEKSGGDYVYATPRERERERKKEGGSKNKPREATKTERRRRDEVDESSIQPMDSKSKKRTKTVVPEQPKRSSSTRRVKKEDKDRSPTKGPADIGISGSKSASRRTKVTAGDPVSRPPLSRSATTRITTEPAPVLRRSNTAVPKPPASIANTSTSQSSQRRGSFLGSFFSSGPPPPPPPPPEPEKLVECLTCLSDDIPKSKCAKLRCGHRMCHSCLKRIFRLSVNDPAHMPPKCCTAEHIPLKHVEKLFDVPFKKLWNKKYQEYTTKNRIYCPAKKCGEWIKPENIHKENGKKYGTCGRCKTKVCALCNGKWHGSKECPKDEETNKLLETAKKAGWQRCYSCRTMVELKEGCNHMTCSRGSCQKSNSAPRNARDRARRQPPANYNEELDQRRRQEREDERLARQLQNWGTDGMPTNDRDANYNGGIGEVQGVGNGADHFMNQDYIREASDVLAQPGGVMNFGLGVTNFLPGFLRPRGAAAASPTVDEMTDRYPAVAPAPVPEPPVAPGLVRRHTTRDTARGTGHTRRASDIVVPRRTRTDYAAEAAIHAPAPRASATPSRVSSSASKTKEKEKKIKSSTLAGLGSGRNRVDAWRNHVAPGAPPAEPAS